MKRTRALFLAAVAGVAAWVLVSPEESEAPDPTKAEVLIYGQFIKQGSIAWRPNMTVGDHQPSPLHAAFAALWHGP